MCIAILSPKGTELSKESLNNCWLNNFNGAGFMYNDDANRLHTFKEMENFDKFYNKYVKIRAKFPNSTMVLHFRISTHGIINKANCHPFKVNSELGFVHNGIIHTVEDDDKYSDTNMFNRTILRKMPGLDVKSLSSKGMKKLMGEFIGKSKLVFMDNMNNWEIINEQKGHWADGLWYSNDSYKKVKDTIDFGGRSVSRNSLNSGNSDGGGSYGGYRGSYGSLGTWGSNTYDSSKYDKKYEGSSWDLAHGDADEIKGYKIANGAETCTCCGSNLKESELTNQFGECLECLTAEEYTLLIKEVTDDGHILKEGITDIQIESQEKEDEICECEYCSHVDYEKNLSMVYGYGYSSKGMLLCKSCVNIWSGDIHDFDEK